MNPETIVVHGRECSFKKFDARRWYIDSTQPGGPNMHLRNNGVWGFAKFHAEAESYFWPDEESARQFARDCVGG